ncbi:polysaccharide pyruvyl transferase family protein [Agromyces albus]|uniref:polysaccharide pyruvyl transferase family protein n=1 Tax=Agromyces albus TaxID=205332 RepID=UPI00277E1F30|nr:polysaccharide pyruvyl transferase family protein [Agromyces albus]MDQ0574566.1 pyruvyl transferase [Agromyces albus]
MIRTYYWQPPVKRMVFGRRGGFRYGNAGDSYNVDLIGSRYPGPVENVEDGGNRLLLVGSIGHRVQPGDVLSGVGVKSSEIGQVRADGAELQGVRGPLSLEVLKRAGMRDDNVIFMADPGLLVAEVFPELRGITPVRNRVIFIPHYRERHRYHSNRHYRVVNIDAPAKEVARRIAEAEVVYSSSLHGLVWAHAIGRPARSVVSLAGEAAFKYNDYFASIGATFRPARSIDEALRESLPQSPIDVSSVVKSIVLPSPSELRARGIMSD